MKFASLLVTAVCVFLLSSFLGNALAATQKGFVQIHSERQLWVEYAAPKDNLPTLIVLNGLTYSTRQWDRFVVPLEKAGFGILRYDMYGMGKTLLKYAPINYTITYSQQVADLHRLLEVMQLEGPHNLLGLSYGGGIAMAYAEEFPEDVNKLILVAPYTEPLKAQDQWIRQQVSLTRITQPWNPSTDDELYDYFLKQNVYWTYPAAEPIVLENPYKLEATFRLVQGIRKWNASESFGSLPTAAVHMMVAQNDQYIPDLVLAEFWKSMPADAYGSYAVVTKSEHKIPEAQPKFAAAWVREILLENEVIADGTVFVADPISGIVRFHGGQLKLKF